MPDMTQTFLSSTAILLAVAYAVCLLARQGRSFADMAIVCGLAGVAALELFDLLALFHPADVLLWKKFSMVAEGCLVPALFLYSLTFAREWRTGSISLVQRILAVVSLSFPVAAIVIPSVSFFYSPDFSREHILFLGNTGFYFYTGFMVFTVATLVNLETTLSGAEHGSRWKIKLEITGVILLLTVLLFYYSQGLLYRTINMYFVPLRSLVVSVAVVIAAYSRLMRGGGVKVSVSKQMAFKSVVLLAVGIYLVGVGLVGEGMKYFGESFQRSLAIALAFLAGTGMVIVFLSETVKRKIKVFLHKNFYQHKYDYRVQWHKFTDRLSSSRSGEDLLLSIVSGFCETFGMGCGSLYLLDKERKIFQRASALAIESSPIDFGSDDPLLETMKSRKWVVNISEQKPEAGEEQAVFLAQHSMVLAVPLFLNDQLEGFILLGRPLDRNETYNYEDYDLMKTLARQGSSAILNLRLSDELSRAREMEAMGRLSAFIMHDLKNLVSTLSLVVDNAKQYIDIPEFQDDMLESLDGTVAKMNNLILRLKKLQEKKLLCREPVDLLEIAGRAARQVGAEEVSVSGASVNWNVDVDEIYKLLLNLILNAIEASGGRGKVSVEVGCDDMAYLRVRDEGCGMSEEFIRKCLFKPFKTTKEKGLGIGLYQCRQIVEAHDGRIEVESEEGKGTSFTVFLPKAVDGLNPETLQPM